MSSAKRYQSLPKQEALGHHDDNDDEHEESALDSLVTTEDSTHNNNSSIFRSSPWTAVPNSNGAGDAITETGSTAGSTTNSRRGNGNGNIVSSTSASNLNSTSSQLQVMLSRSHSNDRSNNNSDGESSDDNSDEWDDDDDDVGAVRRYHMDFEQHNRDNHNLPLPGSAADSDESWYSPVRAWRSFLELRITARQRRAARLLTMPSESFPYKLHACLLTTCCDATDRGILTVVGLMTAWLFLGWAGSMSAVWWWAGIFLFVMRVTARRTFESCLDANRKRMRRRQRLHTSEAAALEAEIGLANSTPVGVADFSTSPDTPGTSATTAAATWGESDATTSLQQVV
jgi:hypothetical protein